MLTVLESRFSNLETIYSDTMLGWSTLRSTYFYECKCISWFCYKIYLFRIIFNANTSGLPLNLTNLTRPNVPYPRVHTTSKQFFSNYWRIYSFHSSNLCITVKYIITNPIIILFLYYLRLIKSLNKIKIDLVIRDNSLSKRLATYCKAVVRSSAISIQLILLGMGNFIRIAYLILCYFTLVDGASPQKCYMLSLAQFFIVKLPSNLRSVAIFTRARLFQRTLLFFSSFQPTLINFQKSQALLVFIAIF